jgi:hypothetical protein
MYPARVETRRGSVTARQPIVATLAEARLLELVPAVAHRLLRTPATWLFGYDFFVSYARKDASRYAERLFQELESRGYVTCFDRSDLHAGEQLPDALARACARSRCTVLVDTLGARESRYVADEIGRVERKGRKGQLIRVMAPKVRPLGFTTPPEPPRTWAHLPRAAQDLLDNAIGVDDPVDAPGVEAGAVSSGVTDQIVKHRRRVRTLRRFGATALAVVAVLGYVIGTLAWQRSITAEARSLTASAVAVNAELATLYSRAHSLGNHAVAAGAIPLALPLEAEAEVQRALRAVLRVIAAAEGAPEPVAADSLLRRVVLGDGGELAWRTPKGALMAGRGATTSAREIAPEGTVLADGPDPVLDWTAVLGGSSPHAVVVHPDRLETWRATDAAPQSSTCRPGGPAWDRAAVAGHLALVASADRVAVVDVRPCTILWQRDIAELEGQSIDAVRIAGSAKGPFVAAIDTGNGVRVLDAASGHEIQRGSHSQTLGQWSVNVTGRVLAAAMDRSRYFALATGPSSSLEDTPYSHATGPILDLAVSPDDAVVVSSTAKDIRIWKTVATNQITGREAMRELILPWSPAGVTFTGPRAAVYAMPRVSARVGAELQPLQIPDALEFTSVPLPLQQIVMVHARDTTLAVESHDSVQLVAVTPTTFWADRVTGGDLPASVEERNVTSASLLETGEIEVRVRAGTSKASAWRWSAGQNQSAWRPVPPTPETTASVTTLPAGTGDGCRMRAGRRYAVTFCAGRVWLSRRTGDRGAWTPQADLSCAVASPECRPPEHPARIRDVTLDEDKDQLAALHVEGRRFFTVTYPLSTRGLRNAVASIDDAIAR